MNRLPSELLDIIIGHIPIRLTKSFSQSSRRNHASVARNVKQRILQGLFTNTSWLDEITKLKGRPILFGKDLRLLVDNDISVPLSIGLAVVGSEKNFTDDIMLRRKLIESLRGTVHPTLLHVKMDHLDLTLNVDHILTGFVLHRSSFISDKQQRDGKMCILDLSEAYPRNCLELVEYKTYGQNTLIFTDEKGFIILLENSEKSSLVRLGLAAQEPFNRDVTLAASRQLNHDELDFFP